MHRQTDENSEVLEGLCHMLTSDYSEKSKKLKRKHKTEDAFNLQLNSESLNQKPEGSEKEKRRKKKHKCGKEPEIEISSDGWLGPEIQLPDPEASNEQKKKRKQQHENKDEFNIPCSGEQLLANENESGKRKKKKKKLRLDREVESGDGNCLVEPVSSVIRELLPEPETSSKPTKKKKKHRREKENEIAIQIENIPTVSNEFIKTENEEMCNAIEIAIPDDEDFMPQSENLSEPEPETSRKQKKKKKHRHEKDDETGSSVVSGESVVHESNKVQKKKRYKNVDDLFRNLHFDIDWILAPLAAPEQVVFNEVQEEINTLQPNRENENDWMNSLLDGSPVEISQKPSDIVPSVLNVPSQQAVTNVRTVRDSSVETSDNVPCAPNVLFQETMINVPPANGSPMEPSKNVPSTPKAPSTSNAPSTTKSPSTQKFWNNLSLKASINIPSTRDSPVDLSQKTSKSISLTHNSVIPLSQEHLSNLQHADDLPVDLSRKSPANVLARDLGSRPSREHSRNDSAVENSVIASSQVRPSSYFYSAAKRRLFTEELPKELPAVSKKFFPTRRVRCVKTCAVDVPEGFCAVSKSSPPAVSKNSSPAVSKKSLPVKRVRCVKTCTIATHEGNSENGHPSQKSVKIRRSSEICSVDKKQEKRTRHPDLPKQPASVYVRFMSDCRRKLLEENPNLTPVQVFVEAGNRYRKLTDEEKAKYANEFSLETKEYNVAIKKFLENHPEHRNRWASEKRNSLEKHSSGSVHVISGQQLYINKRTREHLATHAEDNIRSIMAIYRKEWKQVLDDQEKVVYIMEAKKLNAENTAAVEGPKTVCSDDAKQVTASSYSEMEEQFLRENLVPPPINGYQLFIKENANSELPFGEINRHWKNQLSQEERNSYSRRAKLARETYKKNLAEFEKKDEAEAEFQNLPLPNKLRNALKEEHKLLVSVRKKAAEKPKKHSDVKTGRPPINGRRLFFKERMATVKDLDFKLRFAELNAQWKNQLSEEERDEYSARAKAAYDKFTEEHPELYPDEVEEDSAEQDYVASRDCFEKTQNSKKRKQANEGEPVQQRKRQHMSEGVFQIADILT